MRSPRTTRIRLTATALAAAALFVPVTLAPDNDAPVAVTEACAGNTCCEELGSICDKTAEIRADHYAAESCPSQKTDQEE